MTRRRTSRNADQRASLSFSQEPMSKFFTDTNHSVRCHIVTAGQSQGTEVELAQGTEAELAQGTRNHPADLKVVESL